MIREAPSINLEGGEVPPSTQVTRRPSRLSTISASSAPNDPPKYRKFTEKSRQRIIRKELEYKRRLRDRSKNMATGSAKLVNGKLELEEDPYLELDNQTNDPELEEGNQLPEYRFPDFPEELMWTPVEEIDRSMKARSFVVISSRMKKKYIYRFSANDAWCCLSPLNPIRRFFVAILTNQFFDYFIMLTILTNSIFLTLQNEYKIAESIFLAIYTIECVVRLLARGLFIDKFSYLRDPWNWLDISVVILSYVMIAIEYSGTSSNVNISALRTFRVFRVLKTISIFPGLKTIISALLQSFRMLLEVIILIAFVMSVFALFALQVYMGVYRNKCVKKVDWSNYNMSSEVSIVTRDAYFDSWIKDPNNWLIEEDSNYYVCGNNSGAGRCVNVDEDYTCLPNIGDNPNWGYSNFDDFGWSMLSTFQLITLDYWENQYNYIMRSSGSWNIIFFIAVVYIGAFYLVNLMLAVVTMSYETQATQDEIDAEKQEEFDEEQKEKEKIEEDQHKKKDDIEEDFGFKEKGVDVEFLPSTVRKTEDDAANQEKDEKKPKEKMQTIVYTNKEELVDRNCERCHVCCKCFICWLKIQKFLYVIVNDPFFDLFIIICIVVNTIMLAAEHHPSNPDFKKVLEYSNYFFTTVFTLEAALKIPALSKEYFQSGWNIFDLIVVIASLIDLGVEDVDSLTIFRTFRLFRVFKLAQSWTTMRLLLVIIFNTISALGNLTFILLIVIFIFSIIGMQLFRGTYTKDVFGDDIPRWNFEDFGHSMMMVFRVLCGEWIEPVWDCMRANGELCLAVFIPTLVLGNFVVLNLFLALLLNSFGSDSLKKQEEEEDSKLALAFDRIKRWCCCCFVKCRKNKENDSTRDADSKDVVLEMDSKNDGRSNRWGTSDLNEHDDERSTEPLLSNKGLPNNSRISVISEHPSQEDLAEEEYKREAIEEAMRTGGEEEKEELKLENCFCDCCYAKLTFCNCDHGCGQTWEKIRFFVLRITEHKIFEGIVMVVILVSSISLCFEDIYLDDYPTTIAVLKVLNYIYAILFVIEMLMKWISMGFKNYFSQFWTILDFCIVVVSVVSLIADQLGLSQVSAFRSLRTLRALRPLRAISRWEGMRIVVNALVSSIPSIVNVLLVCLVFWLIFSITGVQFFKGKFYKCIDAEESTIDRSIVKNKTECLLKNYTWTNALVTFDNVGSGYIALYQVATFEGWMEVMESAIDSPSKLDDQPSRENQMGYYVFFVIFIIVGAFFTLNLFIGVIIDNFNALKKEYEGNLLDAFLTENQKVYYHTMKKLKNRKPKKTIRKPKNSIQEFFFNVAISNKFEFAIVIMIFVNMIAMCVEHYRQMPAISQCLEVINIFFTTVFTFEAIIKIVGLRLHYFRIPWNVFDFVIVVLSIVGAILSDLVQNVFVTPTLLRVVRIFRIGRVLRLIKAAKGIRKLLFALVISLPALFNIGALLLLIVFIYAIIGMNVFGNVKHTGAINDMVNFETFERSMVLLFRLTTSAGWNDVFYSLLISDCNNTHVIRNGAPKAVSNGDCSVPWFATIYMCTYIFVAFMVIINMYIAVILENFNQAHEQEEVGITDDDFEEFYIVWERFDPFATQYIKLEKLPDFVAELEPPLGIKKPNIITITSFDLPIMRGDTIHCLDILAALVDRILGGKVERTKDFKLANELMYDKFAQSFPTRKEIPQISSTMRRNEEVVAARILQRGYKMMKFKYTFPHNFHVLFNRPNNDISSKKDYKDSPIEPHSNSQRCLPQMEPRVDKTAAKDMFSPPTTNDTSRQKPTTNDASRQNLKGSLPNVSNIPIPDPRLESQTQQSTLDPMQPRSATTLPSNMDSARKSAFSQAIDTLMRPLTSMFAPTSEELYRSPPRSIGGSSGSSYDEVSLSNAPATNTTPK